MNAIHYIGLDVHKKTISYCIKTAAGQIVKEGMLAAERSVLRSWAGSLQQPWHGAMEATIFSAWIYDTLKPYAERLEMGHPAKMKAITAGKKKSDAIDARTIADLVRCDLLPGCYVFPPDLRDLRRLMRYRHMMVQQSVRMHNKTAGLLMESGVSFHKTKRHGKKYFVEPDSCGTRYLSPQNCRNRYAVPLCSHFALFPRLDRRKREGRWFAGSNLGNTNLAAVLFDLGNIVLKRG
jgi:transposase